MTRLLLTTKLFFPRARSKLVSRMRLIEQLNAGLRKPLTLISAPAGYGKTTLLSDWRLRFGGEYPLAWLLLDSDDNNLARFLTYVSAALGDLITCGEGGCPLRRMYDSKKNYLLCQPLTLKNERSRKQA